MYEIKESTPNFLSIFFTLFFELSLFPPFFTFYEKKLVPLYQIRILKMARKKKPLPILENITIQDIAAEGKCVVRVNDLVVFVPFCVPGDVVDLQIKRKKHSYAEAEVIKFHKLSDVRAVPFCEHFGICGGCKWQNLPYEEQIKAKQKQVSDQLHRIGKIELPEFRPILGSVKTQEYRNKLDFGCSSKQWLTQEQMKEVGKMYGKLSSKIAKEIIVELEVVKYTLIQFMIHKIQSTNQRAVFN